MGRRQVAAATERLQQRVWSTESPWGFLDLEHKARVWEAMEQLWWAQVVGEYGERAKLATFREQAEQLVAVVEQAERDSVLEGAE